MHKALGTFFILFGGTFLLNQFGILPDIGMDIIWPILFIALGVYFLWHTPSARCSRKQSGNSDSMEK